MSQDNANLAMQYSEQVIQLGFVTIFAPAFPIAPLIAVIVNAISIKGELNMYCYYGRRSIAKGAAGIGAWQSIIEFVSTVAVIVNAGIVFFTADAALKTAWFAGFTDFEKFGIVIILEHILIGLKMLLQGVITDIPDWVTKEEYIRETLKDEVLYKVTRKVKKNEKLERDEGGSLRQSKTVKAVKKDVQAYDKLTTADELSVINNGPIQATEIAEDDIMTDAMQLGIVDVV
jgi:hypothetical protein